MLGRIAGVRDLVLGLVTLAALEDTDRLRLATLANAAADAGDAMTFAIAMGSDERTAGSRESWPRSRPRWPASGWHGD